MLSDEEASRTVEVFQDEESYSNVLAGEMKGALGARDVKVSKGALALSSTMKDIRGIFAGNSYLARIRKSIQQFRLGIGAPDEAEEGLRHDITAGDPRQSEFKSDKRIGLYDR